MPTLRRRRSHDDRADARAAGFAAAVGLEVEIERPSTEEDPGRFCASCGTAGQLDMVDATVQRAFLTCPSCARTWDTSRLDQVEV